MIQTLLPWLARKSRPTAEDGDSDSDKRERLRERVRDIWLISILLVPLLAGCIRTVYVPAGTPVRLRETLKDVKVWVKDADGSVATGRMDLPEGWYACLCRRKNESP